MQMKNSTTLDELDEIQESGNVENFEDDYDSEPEIDREDIVEDTTKSNVYLKAFLYFLFIAVLNTGVAFSPLSKMYNVVISVSIGLVITLLIELLL